MGRFHAAAAAFALTAALTGTAASASAVPSADVAAAARLVLARADHGARPFVVVDKRRAMLWLFDGRARPLASTPVLLGAARGDDSVPGIGERAIASITPAERTTPAGRFVAEVGVNTAGEDIIWIDYDAAVSMHRLRTVHESQRRRERLASPTASDNRISYGCINVPAAFFDRHLWPWVRDTRRPMLYVLPETRAVATLFGTG